MKDIWIYVEGGGGKDSKDHMRQAFGQFLTGPRVAAREQRVRWRVVLCGSRDNTFKGFHARQKSHPNAHVFLLVDAEQPIVGSAREHLAAREPWDLSVATDDQCQLMAQVMESWFLADPQALERYYGQQFASKQIPARENVEKIDKPAVFAALKAATRNTSKGKYDKADHAPQILKALDSDRVRSRAPHCDRLFRALAEVLG